MRREEESAVRVMKSPVARFLLQALLGLLVLALVVIALLMARAAWMLGDPGFAGWEAGAAKKTHTQT